MSREHKEPTIIINGTTLTEGQAMTLRVAANSFRTEMSENDALGNDEHGRKMTMLYRQATDEILMLMMKD